MATASLTPPVMRQGVRDNKIVEVPDEETDFEMPNRFFSSHINLIPMHNAVQGPRLFYGARFMNQAMPVKDPEAPWVQNVSEDGVRSYDELMGAHAGAIRADKAGEVTEVTPDHIKWKGEDGVEGKTPLYNSFYFNRKSTIKNTAKVQPGDKFAPGQLLAHSNFTDKDGTLALGKNARIALVPFNGFSMDDAMVVSEDFAKRLTIEQTHHHQVDYERGIKGGLHHFVSLFPSKFTKDQTKLLDEDGVVKQGSIVQKGDPLLLATKPKTINSALQLGKLSKTAREARGDASEIWDEDEPGTVTDVVKTKDGAQVFVQAFHPAKLGSKIVLRSGQKGVISKILPTDQVPRTADGQPVDVLLNHLGIPSRVNSSLPYEILLGKLGELNGKPYKIPAFNKKGEKWYDFVQSELDKHGLKDAEDLYDPTTNEKLENPVTVGNGYVMALHHTATSKFSARGQGGYNSDEQPAKGGGEGAQAKRLSGLESTALMASGAYNILREGATLKGQRCFDETTEVLTRRGWVKWNDVTDSDELLTRSKEDKRAAWYETPLAVIRKKYEGAMLGYEGRHLDWLVTPDHNFWGIPYFVSRKKGYRRKFNFSAETAFGKDGVVDAFGFSYSGKIKAGFLTFDRASVPGSKKHVNAVRMSTIDYCRLIGWWGSEGSARISARGAGEIVISQSAEANPEDFAEIEKLLRRIGFSSISKLKTGKTHSASSVIKKETFKPGAISGLRVRSLPLAKHLMTLGSRSWNKRLPAAVFDMPIEARRELLRCYVQGDGCVRKTGKSEHSYISSSSKGMIDDLQRLAILSGFCAFSGECHGPSYKRPHYRLIISENVTELTYRKRPAAQYKGHYRLENFSGFVFCATMSTGLLFVRRGGKCMWSGNCDNYWRSLRSGYKPVMPGQPFVVSKFHALLNGAGFKARSTDKGKLRLGAFTDKDLATNKATEIRNGEMVDLYNELKPVEGGLFDEKLVGGNGWGYINLPHQLPNPAMEKTTRQLLGLKEKQLRSIIAGEMELPDHLRQK